MNTLPLELDGLLPGVDGSAVFGGPDSCYRYILVRCWQTNGFENAVCFVGLNPSTADGIQDDPTIRRMMGFARRWGYGAIAVVNLFAARATEPDDMKRHAAPVGDHNDDFIRQAVADSKLVIACWGTHGSYLDRDRAVMPLLTNCHCLAETQGRFPAHPLYQPSGLMPKVYEGRPV